MKLLLVVCLVAAVAAAPPTIRYDSSEDEDIQIIRYENYNEGVGNQKAYETSDGTKQDRLDALKDEGREDAAAVRGSFIWISIKGDRYLVKYVAEKQEDQPEDEEPPGGIPLCVASCLVG